MLKYIQTFLLIFHVKSINFIITIIIYKYYILLNIIYFISSILSV